MEKMNKLQMRGVAVLKASELLTLPEIAENAGHNCYAIPVEVNGQEIWVTVTLQAKQWYDTERTKAFDPFVAEAEWQLILEGRKKSEEEREQKKADKIARQKAKREKAEQNKGKVVLGQAKAYPKGKENTIN